MDQKVSTLPRSSGSRLSFGHRPDGRCPHCWMGKVRRPFRGLTRATVAANAPAPLDSPEDSPVGITKFTGGPVLRERVPLNGRTGAVAQSPAAVQTSWQDHSAEPS